MATYRKRHEHWTVVKVVVDGKVHETSCCCADPGGTRRTCMLWSGNKTPCRCHCHTVQKLAEPKPLPKKKGNGNK